ncbi:MAG: DMT family transporter [Breznakibacter sp.]|nr:DMT family transporter [Breznakibacter sp.]
MTSHIGEFAALGVAIVWTITALSFEYAANRVGSLNVNLLRLPFAFIYLAIFTFFTRGNSLPTDATNHQWMWLLLSGVVGFVIGDLFLFKAFTQIGSRFSMLIMTLVPPITALMGWLFLNETLTRLYFFGMLLTVSGIFLAVNSHKDESTNRFSKHSIRGIFYAIGGAIGQAGGLVLSKIGMQNYNPFASTQIRIIAGIVGFTLIMIFMGRIKKGFEALQNREGMKGIIIGSFFGPFIGVSLSLFAIQHANTGVTSTIMSIVPILIIPPSVLIFKQKVTISEIVGAILSVAGITLFFA